MESTTAVNDGILRALGAFYAFAGVLATRAALTSMFVDRALAAISGKAPLPTETARAIWLLCAATLVFVGGVLLALLLDDAAWIFVASALGQAAYLLYVAPQYFDVEDPPDEAGRRQSTNAFVIYAAVTVYILWVHATGGLLTWREVPWPMLAIGGAAIAVHVAYVMRILAKPMRSADPPLFSLGASARAPTDGGRACPHSTRRPSSSRRIKLMADYGTHPLWALDDDLFGDFPPEELGLSAELTRDINVWAEAYSASLDLNDPEVSLWSDEQRLAHEAEARPLSLRLARERPDLTIFVWDETEGVVEVHPDDDP